MSTSSASPEVPAGISMDLNQLILQRVTGMTDGEAKSIICKLVKGADVTEVYSPERVIEAARRMGLKGGLSLDLTTSDSDGRKWD